MGRAKQIKYVILTPKNDVAKSRLEWHGERWEFRRIVFEVKFSREPGPYVVVMSRDGKKCLTIKSKNDPDFDIRMQ
jgi:hypothetical protein